jgi:N-acetylglucosamine malate deacetylase 1
MKKESVIVFCAHSDDHILGAGGTMAKYAKQGKEVKTVIFSYGELASPILLKDKHSIERRVKEAQRADKIIGGSGVIFFGLSDGKVAHEIYEKDIITKMINLIKEIKPKKIFTHNIDDPHPDHRAIRKTLIEVLYEMNYKCDVYSFPIYTPFKLRRRNVLKLVVDITDTFKIKIKALKIFKSQFNMYAFINWFPLTATFMRDFMNGLNNNYRFAEIFYRINLEEEFNEKEKSFNSN